MSNLTCETCIYWFNRDRGGTGLCRRTTPPWDGTYDKDWCGEGVWRVEDGKLVSFIELIDSGRTP
jgi:hypothetical protein